MRDRPIFIVGASRSGTAVLRSSLNRHPDLHIAGETHFFDDLRLRIPTDTTLEGADRDGVVELFQRLSHRPYGHGGRPEEGWLDAQAIIDRAAARGGRADDFFAAWCELEGLHDDGVLPRRWGEKTPRHAYRIDDMLAAFPDAQVIAMVRDPRAVVASYRDWRTDDASGQADDRDPDPAMAEEAARVQQSYHPALATLLWRATVRRAADARRNHGPDRVHVARYEDLVTEPDRVLRKICAWLGEDFDEGMVAVPVHNSSYMTFEREGGFRREAIDRWRDVLDDDEVAVVQAVAGSILRACRYPEMPVRAQTLLAASGMVDLPPALLHAARANQQRIDDPFRYALRRLRALA